MNINYHRKIYALLQSTNKLSDQEIEIECLKDKLPTLTKWWREKGKKCAELAKTSDRVTLESKSDFDLSNIEICHLISGQKQTLTSSTEIDYQQFQLPQEIGQDAEKIFWWHV